MDPLYAESVLSCEAGEDRRAVAAPCLDRLQVGLDACAAAGIASWSSARQVHVSHIGTQVTNGRRNERCSWRLRLDSLVGYSRVLLPKVKDAGGMAAHQQWSSHESAPVA